MGLEGHGGDYWQRDMHILGRERPVGIPVVAQWESIHEDVGLIPGLTQWVKDLALLQAAVWVADTAWIQYCCGCGTGLQLELQFDLWPGNFRMPQVWS